MRLHKWNLPWSSRGIALSDLSNAVELVVSLEAQFQPVTDASVSAVILMVDLALRSYFLTLATVPKLTTLTMLTKSSCVSWWAGFGTRTVSRTRLWSISPRQRFPFPAQIFNTVLRPHQFPKLWKEAKWKFYSKTAKGFGTALSL